MDLEKLLELLFKNPNDNSISYSNINGKEKLIINGEEITNETYDDSQVKKLIAEYKENINLLDDCTFIEVIEEIEESINLKDFDILLNKDHFTENEAEFIKGQIEFINTIVCENIKNKIQDLTELLERF